MVPKNLLSSETDACDESQTAFTNYCSLTQVEECSYLILSEGQLFLLESHVAPSYSELFMNQHFQFIHNKGQRMKHNTLTYCQLSREHSICWAAWLTARYPDPLHKAGGLNHKVFQIFKPRKMSG